MTTFRERYGPCALVAGAAVGLGAAWSRALGGQGLDLVLVDRDAEPLRRTALEIEAAHGVAVRAVMGGGSCSGAPTRLVRQRH